MDYNSHDLDDYEDTLKYFSNIQEFYKKLLEFLYNYPAFVEITGLDNYQGVAGYYVIAFERTQKFYVAYSENIGLDIEEKWVLKGKDIFDYSKIFVLPVCEDSLTAFHFVNKIKALMTEDFIQEACIDTENACHIQKWEDLKRGVENFWNRLDKKKCCGVVIGVTSTMFSLIMFNKLRKRRK